MPSWLWSAKAKGGVDKSIIELGKLREFVVPLTEARELAVGVNFGM